MRRRGALERGRAKLRADAEPGPDPELLRERMPDVLRFIREWVTEADGDELTLVLQALEVRVDVSPEEVDVRVEAPMIEAVEGADLVTTERTSGLAFRSYKIERVPLVVTVPLSRLRRQPGGA